MVDLVQKLFECHKRRFLHTLQTDFFLGHNELEADKKAVVYLIVANHGHKGFRLFIYLLYRHITKSPRYQLF